MKLAVAVAGGEEWGWLDAFHFEGAGISPVVLHLAPPAPGSPLRGRTIGHRTAPESSLVVPEFAGIIEALSQEKPEACLVLTGGLFGALVSVGAEALGVPVFRLVLRKEDLAASAPNRAERPDLLFLADRRLFPAALEDPRYGSTLLPTGHPAADVGPGDSGGDFAAPHFGDGRAAERILTAIGRWRTGALAPGEPDLTVIVPAYREAENLPLVCDRLLETFSSEPISAEILLVDDSSPDDTYAVALEQMWRSPAIRAYSKPTPRGMGNGIRFGLTKARAPIVAVTMGDGSDEVSRIPEMFRKVRDEGFALAIGSRYRHRRNYATVPLLYRFWSRLFRFVAWASIGVKVNDYTNAFRVFHRRIFARYGPESGGFEISPEITFKAWFASRRVTEVDVRHLKRSSGQSSFSFLRAGPGYGKILIKAFVNRLTGRWFTLDW